MDRISRSLMYVADAIESGYSSVFTFGVKEILNNEERKEVASLIRELSASRTPGNFNHRFNQPRQF